MVFFRWILYVTKTDSLVCRACVHAFDQNKRDLMSLSSDDLSSYVRIVACFVKDVRPTLQIHQTFSNSSPHAIPRHMQDIAYPLVCQVVLVV